MNTITREGNNDVTVLHFALILNEHVVLNNFFQTASGISVSCYKRHPQKTRFKHHTKTNTKTMGIPSKLLSKT